jgi:hypothetical protein
MDIKPKKKNIVQDVVPPGRSIRNIELPSRRDRKVTDIVQSNKTTSAKLPISKKVKEDIVTKDTGPVINTNPDIVVAQTKPRINNQIGYNFEYDEQPKSSKKILYFSVLILVIAVGLGLSALFKGATIEITPKDKVVTFNENFTAKKTNDSNLPFQSVILSKDSEKTVPATEEQKVSRKASGKIVINNRYSSQSQPLLINTRFETPEGLIFKTVKAVVVPGKGVNPGQVEVEVIADEPGQKYNVGLKDFKIVGFRGHPKYDTITAVSVTPISGGFDGVEKIVSENVLSQAELELETALKTELSREIMSQIPDKYVLYKDSISYKFEPLSQASSTPQTVLLRKKGTASAIIIDKGSLSKIITTRIMPDIADDLVKISNLESLTFSYSNESSFDPNLSNSVSFTLKGDAKFEWIFDENKLKSELLGLSKDKARTVISTYKSINIAKIETRPFWNKTIPTDSNKVKIVNTLYR